MSPTSSPSARVSALERPASSPVITPWRRSWLYTAPGEAPVLVWIALLHVVGVVGLVLAPAPSLGAIAGALALLFLGGLGTTVVYHRALTHKGLKLHPVVEQVLIFFAIFNGSGTPLTWVANHRLHHAHSDKAGDISSPLHGGFWWSHVRWLWQAGQADPKRWCPDLKGARYAGWTRWQIPVLAVSLLFGLAFGWDAWLWLGPIRLLWALHAQCTVNSVCHLGEVTADRDSSRNVWWLAPLHLFQGENWHANHHGNQVDPRLGQGARQVDIGWWTILALERVGLASRVRRPSRNRLAA